MVLDKMIQEENGEINLQKASIMPLSCKLLLVIFCNHLMEFSSICPVEN